MMKKWYRKTYVNLKIVFIEIHFTECHGIVTVTFAFYSQVPGLEFSQTSSAE
jgi:hypothetical protein